MKINAVQNSSGEASREGKAAKAARILTSPPAMALWLILIVSQYNRSVFLSNRDVWAVLLGLVIIPVLAYPIQRMISRDDPDIRKKQRRLAFVLNIIGYLGLFIYCLICNVNGNMMLISSTYLFAVIVLAIINKFSPFHASGHACCVCAPLVLIIRLVSWKWIWLCLALAAMMVWASLYLKRHTVKELILGAVAFLMAYGMVLITF